METVSSVIENDGIIYIYQEIDKQLEKEIKSIPPENKENFIEDIESEFLGHLELIESLRNELRNRAGLPQENIPVKESLSIVASLNNLKETSEETTQEIPRNEHKELSLEFGVYFLELTRSSINKFDRELRTINPEKPNDAWKKIARENERFSRRIRLKSPLDQPSFEADLQWMRARGEEEEDFVALQQARFEPLYFSEDIRRLFELAEDEIRQKLKGKGLEFKFYKIFATQAELQNIQFKLNIVKSYPAWSIVVSNTTSVSSLQKYYPLEQFNAISRVDEGVGKVRDYVVRLIAPISDSFKEQLEKIKAEFLQSLGGQEIVVAVPGGNADTLSKLKSFGQVDSVKPFIPNIRVQTQYLENLKRKVTEEMIIAARLEAAKHPPQHHRKSIPLPGILIAKFFTSEDCEQAQETFIQQGIRVAEKAGKNAIVLDLKPHPDPMQAFELIKQQVGLKSLEEDIINTLFNDSARSVIASGVIPSNPHPDPSCLDLTGKGETIAICDSGLDTGDLGTLHLDFYERVHRIQSYPIQPRFDSQVINPGDDDGASDRHSGHGTHVAGSALGNGKQSSWRTPAIKGIASEAELIFQAVEQSPRWDIDYIFDYFDQTSELPPSYGLCGIPSDLTSLFEAAFDNGKGAKIYSISWGRKDNEFHPGAYSDFCEQLDTFIWENKEFVAIVAAGNFGQCVSSPGIAKNCITVGASENDQSHLCETYGDRWPYTFPHDCDSHTNGLADSIDDIALFSNRGPCATGRRKPDLVAPGTYILSTRSSQIPANHFAEKPYPQAEAHYMYMHGTSMATPLVAGCAALVRQYLREHQITMDAPRTLLIQGNPEHPSAALVKAILIHSSQYLSRDNQSTVRADNHQGWGRINLCQVLNPQTPEKVLFIDESQGLVTGDLHEYAIALQDPSVPLRVTLVYTDPPGEKLINNLNLTIYSPSSQYYCGNDFERIGVPDKLNNVEGCFVIDPEIGQWRIRVVAENITQDSQDYALVISGGEIEQNTR